ncbi:uncharacterized protein LOC123548153 [Mercenaria mercenaria]|uniref:uncharacterized protein LOC123548153 n=1 Tax=Mercenaria mercenaria TaxID=6596 RepID=UPI00234E986B|nr:uncharacterized protein LOC123548153 [Mercenaria mercenaria]
MERQQNSETKVEHLENSSDKIDKFKSLDKGWSWVIMVASFGAFCLIGANMYGAGIMQATLLKRYRSSVSLTAWAGSLQPAFMSLGGCGAGVGYTASTVVMEFNFKRRRLIALGFAVSGMGAGIFALSHLMQLARNYYGSTGFFIIQATISLNIVTFGAMFFPSQLELHTQEMRKCNKDNARFDKAKSNSGGGFTQYFKALVNKQIALLSVGMFLNCVGSHIVYLHMPVYIVSTGFTASQAA